MIRYIQKRSVCESVDESLLPLFDKACKKSVYGGELNTGEACYFDLKGRYGESLPAQGYVKLNSISPMKAVLSFVEYNGSLTLKRVYNTDEFDSVMDEYNDAELDQMSGKKLSALKDSLVSCRESIQMTLDDGGIAEDFANTINEATYNDVVEEEVEVDDDEDDIKKALVDGMASAIDDYLDRLSSDIENCFSGIESDLESMISDLDDAIDLLDTKYLL